MAAVTLTQEEIKSIRDLQIELNDVTLTLGNIEVQFLELKGAKDLHLEKIQGIRTKQNTLGSELNSKYGKGTIDLETGIFTPVA